MRLLTDDNCIPGNCAWYSVRNTEQEADVKWSKVAVSGLGVLLCAGFAPCLLAAENGIPFEIKESGKAPYTLTITAITLAPDAAAYEKQAASALSGYFSAMTGISIPVRELQPQDSGKNMLLVGKPAVEKGMISKEALSWCGPEGYMVVAGKDSIALERASLEIMPF